jgi:glutamine amidotransferase
MRELWGRHWIFAHNGDLKDYSPFLTGVYQPVGTTDSELAFCALLQGLRKAFPTTQPPLEELFAVLGTLTREITQFGVFNFLMSNGQALFAHCSTNLHYIVRRWPFSTAHLVDADVSIDFAKYTTPEDRVAVIATQPLTDNEVWTAFQPGDLLMFQHGDVAGRVNVPVPPCVLAKLRNPATDVSASASTPLPLASVVAASRNPTVQESDMLDVEAADDAAAFES